HRAEMKCRACHYTTVSAPALMSVVGPSMLIAAPLPFEITMPTSLTEIVAPVVDWIRIPPVGPGRSLTTMPFFTVVSILNPVAARRSGAPGRGRRGRVAPVPADPDRPIGVALFELDPHARTDLRDGEEACVDPGAGQARHRPRGRDRPGDVGHDRLDAPDLL